MEHGKKTNTHLNVNKSIYDKLTRFCDLDIASCYGKLTINKYHSNHTVAAKNTSSTRITQKNAKIAEGICNKAYTLLAFIFTRP